MLKWWRHNVSKRHNSSITTVRIYGEHFPLTRWYPPRNVRCHKPPQDHDVKTSLEFTCPYIHYKKSVTEHLGVKVGQFELGNSGCKSLPHTKIIIGTSSFTAAVLNLGSVDRCQGVHELGWGKKLETFLSLVCNWNLAFQSIVNVGNKVIRGLYTQKMFIFNESI
jgi:hypothetical protein